MEFKLNSVNQVTKDTIFFQRGYPVEFVGMLVRGRTEVTCSGTKTLLGSGSFLGLNDIYRGEFTCDYKAYDDVVLYVFPAEGEESIRKILTTNKDYHGLSVMFLERFLSELCKTGDVLEDASKELYRFIMECYKEYQNLCLAMGHSVRSLAMIQSIESPAKIQSNLEQNKVQYYLECAKIPMDAQKAYYGNSVFAAIFQIGELSKMVDAQLKLCSEYVTCIQNYFSLLIHGQDRSLFHCEISLAMEIQKDKQDLDKVMNMVDLLIEKINATENLMEQYTDCTLKIDRDWMERVYASLLSSSQDTNVDTSQEDLNELVDSVNGSLHQIINFIALEPGIAEPLIENIQKFVDCRDRMASDDDTRKLRKSIEEQFYGLYKMVFLHAYTQQSIPKAVELFLEYGFLDERLLQKDQIMDLCSLKQSFQGDFCRVYTMREWLTAIYEGKKEPSKNDMSMDYADSLRHLKKIGTITPEKEALLLKDQKRKFDYEIMNAFRSTSKMVNGQVLAFIPILHEDMLYSGVKDSYVTKEAVNKIFNKLIQVDYSIFHREVLYMDSAKGIDKEYIMKQVLPDVILSPVPGSSGAMWQEIDGRKRSTPGRFMLPSLAMISLEDILAKLFGQYRWEMCKTIQGVNWNNIQYRSITSEYSDYIQFYRKNRLLSVERKEKLKLQIQKNRNILREVFTSDYVVWIKNEVDGSMRLNKVTREMLATYCPFNKEVREVLEKQPVYEEAFTRFEREKQKKVRELELRYHALIKAKVTIPSEIEDTLSFFKNN